MWVQLFYFILSIVGLYFGAEITLESAEKVGKSWKLSPLLIGLFIVGFGTSLPEFFISQLASFRGHSEMALGNIVGSNIANVFLILGLSSLFTSLSLSEKDMINHLIFHLVLTSIMVASFYFQKINLLVSLVMLLFFIVYIYFNFSGKQESEIDEVVKVNFFTYIKLIGGFAILYFSGELLVFSGSKIGALFGVSEYALSAIFVAFGTSFPELVTALLACYKKKDTSLITGNIIGSNIFNGAFVLGSIGPYEIIVKRVFHSEMALLMFAAVVMLLFCKFKIKINHYIGPILLGVYGVMVYFWL